MIELFKLTFDLSYFFTLVGFYYACFTGRLPMTGFLLLTGMIAADIVLRRFERLPKPVRSIAFLIPLAVVFTDTPVPDVVFLLFPYVYLAVSMWTDRVETDRMSFAHESRLFMKILPVIALGFFVPDSAVPALSAAVPYIIIMLYSMIWLLRFLRTPESKKKTQILAALSFAAFTLLCTVGRLPELLVKGFELLYEYVIGPGLALFATGFGYIVYGIGWIIKKLFVPSGMGQEVEMQEAESAADGAGIIEETVTGSMLGEILAVIGKVLLVIVVIAAVCYLLYKLLGKRRAKREEGGYTEEQGVTESEAPRRRGLPRFRPFNPREAIRYDYARFLKEAGKRGVEIGKGTTTQETVTLAAHDFPEEALAELRELYVLARYAPNEEISREEASRSAAAYRRLKSSRRTKEEEVSAGAVPEDIEGDWE